MPRVGTVSVGFESDTSKFIAGVNQVNKSLSGIQKSADFVTHSLKALIGALGVRELIHFATETAHFAEKISVLSLKLKASVEDIQGFTHAAEQMGVAGEEFQGAWQKVVTSAQMAASGISTRMTKAFEQLGIDVKDFVKLSGDQQLLVFIERLKAAGDASNQLAIAQRLAGESGTDLIAMAKEGSAKVLDLKNQWDSLNASLSGEQAQAVKEMGDAWKTVSEDLKGLGMQIVAGLAKPLTELGKWLVTEFPKYVKQFIEWVARMADASAEFVTTWTNNIHEWVKQFIELVKAGRTLALALKKAVIDALTFELPAPLKKMMDRLDQFSANTAANGAIYQSGDPFNPGSYRGGNVIDRGAATQPLPGLGSAPFDINAVGDKLSENLDTWNAGLDELNKLLTATPTALHKFADAARGAADAIHPLDLNAKATNEQIDELNHSMQRATFDPANDMGQWASDDKVKKEWAAWDKSIGKANYIGEYFTKAMQGALANFGDNFIDVFLHIKGAGKDAFKQLTASILQDLATIILKATMLKLLLAAFDPSSSGWTGAIGKFLFPTSAGTGAAAAPLPTGAFGADFTVGGTGGNDSRVVAFRSTPGARITETPPGMTGLSDASGGVTIIQNNTYASGVDRTALAAFAQAQKADILKEVASQRKRNVR